MKAKVWQPESICVCLLRMRETWIEEIGRRKGPDQREKVAMFEIIEFRIRCKNFCLIKYVNEVEVLVKSFLHT